jgi:septal ring factor EnvC (AmiA/AmiB activator)
MSWNSFSQTATTDSLKIQLSKPIAKLVIKDLIKYDGLTQEVNTVRSILEETNNKLQSQTDLVVNLRSQITNYKELTATKDEQLFQQQAAISNLQKSLKKANRTKKLYKIGSTLGLASTALLLLK